MIDVYIITHTKVGNSFACYQHEATFCEKTYWDNNKCIDDGFNDTYDTIVEAFDKEGIDTVMDGTIRWNNMTAVQMKDRISKHGINLIVDDTNVRNDFISQFGQP